MIEGCLTAVVIFMDQISATAQNRRALIITFVLTFGYFVVEVVGGVLTNSLEVP